MRTGQFYDKLSDLNDSLYHIRDSYADWKIIDKYSDSTGLQVFLFDVGNEETLLAIKGSDIKFSKEVYDDFRADLAIKQKQVPAQYSHLEQYYTKIKNTYKKIIFTGYSLGGTLAQMLGTVYGNETITFEACAAGELISPSHTTNIINYGNLYNIVFMEWPNSHIGAVYLIPLNPTNKLRFFNTHIPFHHGKPSQGKICTTRLESNQEYFERLRKETIQVPKDLTRKGYIKTQQELNRVSQKAIKITRNTYQRVRQAHHKVSKGLNSLYNLLKPKEQ